jgi:hypothetical protein
VKNRRTQLWAAPKKGAAQGARRRAQGKTIKEKLSSNCGSLLELLSIVKYQIPSTESQGVRCQVSGVRKKET